MPSFAKPEVHNLSQWPPEDRATVTGNAEKNLAVWFLRYVSGQTNKQTNSSQYTFHIPAEAKQQQEERHVVFIYRERLFRHATQLATPLSHD